MRYLYTNLQLTWILDRDGDGKIDWATCGFKARTVSKYMQKGKCQGEVEGVGHVSILPITDEDKVIDVVLPQAEIEKEESDFCRIIEQEEADAIALNFMKLA